METKTASNIEQYAVFVNEQEKIRHMISIAMYENPDSCIIFTNTQHMASRIEQKLKKEQFSYCKLHGGAE